ncbi:ABC transporter ATP-binding protein [Marinomonas posidonica]|uniref:ABC transporter ATP-binding protein n=1 Tax=Marinomonas posidonica TaxID=936476 RepID=UPI0037357E95
MLMIFKQIFSVLLPSERKQFYILQLLVVFMAFTELLGIASIAPFMALVGDISLLDKPGFVSNLYLWSGLKDPMDFLFFTGLSVLLLLAFSTIISMLTIWKLSLYGARVGIEIADRLYEYYMRQEWLFHSIGSSASLTKKVSTEAVRVSDSIIQPLMLINSKLVLAIFISVSIFIYDPIVAIGGLLLFSLSYFLLYRLVRRKLDDNGKEMSDVYTERFRLMNEGFGGIRDVILLNRNESFILRFKKSGRALACARGENFAISQVPRYFMELIAFGAMIILVLFLIKLHQGELGAVLPILGVYALASFKLLPALQQVYSGMAQIKGNLAAFEAIKDDLYQSLTNTESNIKPIEDCISLKKKIVLKDICFQYPGKDKLALDKVNIVVPANNIIGIVGSSGSGKSTTIDLLLGLLSPMSGKLYIDEVELTLNNKRNWQDKVGFVPQSIYLSEGTIAENVAFGVPFSKIDLSQVKKALSLAHLTELVDQLPRGVNTQVGERGVQLSGGQRQRIGIARALYHEANVLVFDEATSALDGITEKIIMEAIHDFCGQKTIVMIAHRLKTIKKCNIIYMMEDGKVVDKGTYEELLSCNAKFKEMAEHA